MMEDKMFLDLVWVCKDMVEVVWVEEDTEEVDVPIMVNNKFLTPSKCYLEVQGV